jgi:hypothetical protein
MTQNVVLAVKTSAAVSTPVYFSMTGAGREGPRRRWHLRAAGHVGKDRLVGAERPRFGDVAVDDRPSPAHKVLEPGIGKRPVRPGELFRPEPVGWGVPSFIVQTFDPVKNHQNRSHLHYNDR